MVCFFRSDCNRLSSDFLRRIILALWCLGLLIGAYVACVPVEFAESELRLYCQSQNFLFVFLVRIVPVLFLLLATLISNVVYWFPVVFGKAFLFSYVGTRVVLSFGLSSWIICFLMLFGELLVLPAYFLFLFETIPQCRRGLSRKCVFAVLAILTASYIEFTYVAPFFDRLILR